jgi:hypothetical protein
LLGAGAEKKASKNAQSALVTSLNNAIGTQQHQYDQSRTDFAPYLAAGTSALGGLGDLAGINGNDKWSAALAQLQESPLYKTLFRNGQETLLQNASATGGMRGGNMQRGLADFGADTLAQVYQNQIGNLGGLANMGLGATGNISALGQSNANQVAGLQQGIGNANAQGILTRGGLTAGMWNSAGGFLDSAVSAFLPGGGGFKSLF